MVRTIATAQPSGRKRRRNERDPEATYSIGKSQPSSTFPRISSAPPRRSSTPAFFHSASHSGSQANVVKATPSSPLQRNAPVSDADLEAMITTLSLIHKHGYGSEPGKPSIRCRTAGSCRRGRRGNATVESCFSSRGSALKGRGTSSGNRSNKDSRGGSSSRSPCRPWTAPSSSVTGLGRPLERRESKVTTSISGRDKNIKAPHVSLRLKYDPRCLIPDDYSHRKSLYPRRCWYRVPSHARTSRRARLGKKHREVHALFCRSW